MVATKVSLDDPRSYREATLRSDHLNWSETMEEEIGTIDHKGVWFLVHVLVGRNVTEARCFYLVNRKVKGF